MKAAVVGLGKIGLPLAVQIAGAGVDVVGLDIDAGVVDLVNAGKEPFPGEADLAGRLQAVLDSGRLRATLDADEAVGGADAVIVVVPLVVDAEARPDFAALDAATAAVAPHLSPGVLVSYETTLPLRSTRDRFVPALEDASGLVCGRDLFVVHSPERVYSGRIFADLRRYPKLVGGVDAESAARAVGFYSSVLEFDERPDLARANGVWDLGSAEAAELAKLAETTYRDLNIAFSNELAEVSEDLGVEVRDVISACNSQPFSHLHQPGIAVGGHCIPVYPRFLLAGTDVRLPGVARSVNDSVPARVAADCSDWMGGLEGCRVVILGVAYRGGVRETAFSGAFQLRDALIAAGADVMAHDPLYAADELRALGFSPYEWGSGADLAVVQADHAEYSAVASMVPDSFGRIYDGRGVLEPGPLVRRLGSPVVT